ncbi:MAG: hypothetical protein JXA42_22510 [Anaerolineales bacterium]|nr:hypothetical protein [Anaerolineales bacterium]
MNTLSQPTNKAAFRIRVQGHIDQRWSGWLGDLDVEYLADGPQSETTMSGRNLDQAALRGILIKLWDLNLTLISVDRIDADRGGEA